MLSAGDGGRALWRGAGAGNLRMAGMAGMAGMGLGHGEKQYGLTIFHHRLGYCFWDYPA